MHKGLYGTGHLGLDLKVHPSQPKANTKGGLQEPEQGIMFPMAELLVPQNLSNQQYCPGNFALTLPAFNPYIVSHAEATPKSQSFFLYPDGRAAGIWKCMVGLYTGIIVLSKKNSFS